MEETKEKGRKLRRVWVSLLTMMLLAGMLVLPASALTMDTLVATKDYFLFEGGIIKTDWTKVISHVTEDGAITSKDIVSYRPTVYIPLGTKINLTQDAINKGYRMVIATVDDPTIIESDLASYAYNVEEKCMVAVYRSQDVMGDGSILPYYDIRVVGVMGGTAANLSTPFADISYFDEPIEVVGLYNKLYHIVLSEELRGDIEWVYHQGLMPGLSAMTFSPFEHVTKAQVATILWTYSGKPEPSNMNNPFEDVSATEPYYKAVLWAYENGILLQYTPTTFNPTWKATKTQVTYALNKMFDCELPQTIHDGEEKRINIAGLCTRVNMAHYLHYAHIYTTMGTVPDTTPNIFTDVNSSAYYADAVSWAVSKAITNGTSTTAFSPEANCTQAQILTFLWRATGKPTIDVEVRPTWVDKTYQEAVLWAASKNMLDIVTFDPDKPCTRSTAVSYIWQALGCPTPATSARFTDVSQSAAYAQAVSWAVGADITNGTSTTTFSPDDTCTRGQIVTFLYRAMG